MKKLLIILITIIGLFGFKLVKAEEIKKNEFVINDWVDYIIYEIIMEILKKEDL